MTLPWIRLDSTIYMNHKMLNLIGSKRHKAVLAYLFGLAYSGGHELDGFVPTAALPFLHATVSDAAALVEAGLWEVSPGGWLINDWNEFQASSDEMRQRRERAQKAAQKRWHGDAE
jgi:hypothetical protein